MSFLPPSRALRSSTSRSSEPRATLTSIPAPGVGTTGKRGLIDTSVAIVLATIDRNSLPERVAVSSLTFAELIVGPHGATHDLARAIDVMIAATALAHDLPLYTRNAKDLRGLEHLIEIVDVSA
jgi:predicted nucleic acid-binding protein